MLKLNSFVIEITRLNSEVLLQRIVDVKIVLMVVPTRDSLLKACVLFPFKYFRWAKLNIVKKYPITYHFHQLVNLECLRENHFEAKEWHLGMQVRASLLHVVRD